MHIQGDFMFFKSQSANAEVVRYNIYIVKLLIRSKIAYYTPEWDASERTG